MKLLVFSDLHAHMWAEHASILPDGRNSRIMDAVNIIAQIKTAAIENKCTTIVFTGDAFHIRSKVYTKVFNAIDEALCSLTKENIEVFLLVGNHDQVSKQTDSDHSLEVFKKVKGITVIDTPGLYKTKAGVELLGIPYYGDATNIKEAVTHYVTSNKKTVLIAHCGVQGSLPGTDMILESEVPINYLQPDKFKYVFLGHYHAYQKVAKNVYYPGSAMAHTWGDKNQTKGYLLVDGKSVVFKEFNTPKFLVLEDFIETQDINNLKDPKIVTGNYIKILLADPDLKFERKLLKKLEEYKPLSVEICYRPKEQKSKVRINIDMSMSYETMLENYVNSGIIDLNGLDSSKLIKVGKELLNKAGKEL